MLTKRHPDLSAMTLKTFVMNDLGELINHENYLTLKDIKKYLDTEANLTTKYEQELKKLRKQKVIVVEIDILLVQ